MFQLQSLAKLAWRQVEPEVTMSIIRRAPATSGRGLDGESGIPDTGRVDEGPHVAEGDVYLVPAQDRRRRAAEDFQGDVDGGGGSIDHRWGREAPRDDESERHHCE